MSRLNVDGGEADGVSRQGGLARQAGNAEWRFWAGLITGLGSSAADLLYACAGVFGITLVSELLTRYQRPVSLLDGVLIAALGMDFARKDPKNLTEKGILQIPLTNGCTRHAFHINPLEKLV